ncbi:ABC transporter permease [Georgenia deserti]|uniref:ABC transporter permease n=1 Tax=Georgenia deserti TaxID=2093781 RepID=A0ABW4L7J8_9MICO
MSDNPWFSWHYLENNWRGLADLAAQHVSLTVQAVLIALVMAVPLALLARGSQAISGAVLGTSAVLYTVPSIGLFGLLAPFTGIGRTTVLIGLVAYAMLVLVRNTLVGLRGVPPDVVDAARGMGYSPARRFLAVELPLALPAILTGVRLATVTTIALVTVGVVVGYGGLGQAMFRGFSSSYRAEIVAATLLTVAIALVADLLLLTVGRLLIRWRRP